MSDKMKPYLPSQILSPDHTKYAGPRNLTPREKEEYKPLEEESFFSGEGD
jgi:hypothetical protein